MILFLSYQFLTNLKKLLGQVYNEFPSLKIKYKNKSTVRIVLVESLHHSIPVIDLTQDWKLFFYEKPFIGLYLVLKFRR